MKIVICIPYYGMVPFPFVRSLADLLLASSRMKVNLDGEEVTPAIEVIDCTSTALADSRNTLLQGAIDRNANFILWLDADMTFPPDTLARLMAHNQTAVACNYIRRDRGGTVAFDGSARVMTTTEKAKGPLEKVQSTGLGICLLRAGAINALKTKGADEAENLFPVFECAATGGEEDVNFFRKLRAAGIPLYIDHALSMEVGHIAETVLTFPR